MQRSAQWGLTLDAPRQLRLRHRDRYLGFTGKQAASRLSFVVTARGLPQAFMRVASRRRADSGALSLRWRLHLLWNQFHESIHAEGEGEILYSCTKPKGRHGRAGKTGSRRERHRVIARVLSSLPVYRTRELRSRPQTKRPGRPLKLLLYVPLALSSDSTKLGTFTVTRII
jgi:hypothetical protein